MNAHFLLILFLLPVLIDRQGGRRTGRQARAPACGELCDLKYNCINSKTWTDVDRFPPQYLHKLFKRDHHKGQKYHERQIGLYAEYDRPNLLPFLRDSTHCPLEKV